MKTLLLAFHKSALCGGILATCCLLGSCERKSAVERAADDVEDAVEEVADEVEDAVD